MKNYKKGISIGYNLLRFIPTILVFIGYIIARDNGFGWQFLILGSLIILILNYKQLYYAFLYGQELRRKRKW